MRTSVVILNYNGYTDTVECIDSIRQSGHRCQLILVDNASSGNELSRLQEYLWRDELLVGNSENSGYAGGCNTGLERAFSDGADAVFLLNNDVIVDHDCVGELVAVLEQYEDVGVIGPMVLYHNDPEVVSFAGMAGEVERARYRRLDQNRSTSAIVQGIVPTLYQEGCAIMITRRCYQQVGGFDERLWAYWEDADYCQRVRRAGYRVLCNRRARVWHKVSRSFGDYYCRTPQAVYLNTRNELLFHRRYAPTNAADRLLVLTRIWGKAPRRAGGILFHAKRFRWRNLASLLFGTIAGTFGRS